MIKLFLDSVFVGVIIMIVGICVSFIVSKLLPVKLPKVCKKWNKNHIMEICLFFTGFFSNIILTLYKQFILQHL